MKHHSSVSKHRLSLLPVLLLLLPAAALLSLTIGRYPITLHEILSLFSEWITGTPADVEDITRTVFFQIRLPRIGAAILIGASLAVSGASYQGILRNPIVSPDILGAAAGAGFGAALGILFDLPALLIQLLAFAFGLLAVGIAFFTSQTLGNRTGSIIALVLSGMVVTALFSAFISIIKYVGDPYDTLPALTFWLMGGLTYVTGEDFLFLILPFLAGMIPLMLIRWKMNLLCFHPDEAQAMGVPVRWLQGVIILCATLLTCSAVAIGGMIGWVGLIVPHLCRMLTGPDYKRLLPVTLAGGGLFLLLVDNAARCIGTQELPLGVLTAVIGAPCFLFELRRERKGFI